MASRNSDFEAALAGYRELEARDPQNAIWPQRRAEIFERQGLHTQAIKGFEHALGIAIDRAEIIAAVAIAKQILAIDPNHSSTLERLHLLYAEPQPPETLPPQPDGALDCDANDAPLEEVLLTETVPGAAPDASSDLENPGVVEIPLPRIAHSTTRETMHDDRPSGAREQLMNTPLFGSLDAASMRELIKRVKLISLSEGEVLFRQGDRADSLYVVAHGAVVPIAEEGLRKKLAVLETGAFFGEIGLMTDRPRNATIQALVESQLLAIDRKAMWTLIRKHPRVLDVMLCFLRDRLVDRLTRTNPLMGAFPAKQRRSVARLFRFLEVQSGCTLIEQGRTSENLFALLAGSAQVIQMDIAADKVLAELEPGCIFGEMSVLEQTPAVAAVVASSKCWVLALSRERLLHLLEHNPQAETIIKQMVKRRESENMNTGHSPLAGTGEQDLSS